MKKLLPLFLALALGVFAQTAVPKGSFVNVGPIAAAPAGTTPVGTTGITATQVAFGDTVANTIKGTANLTFLDGTTAGQLIHPVGAAATPSLTFLGDTDTGLYWASANTLGFSTAGTPMLTLGTVYLGSASGATGSVLIRSENNGDPTAPIYTFTGDANTGFYRVGADELGVALGGAEYFSFQLTGGAGHLKATTGSATAAPYTFNGDLNTGMYRVSADILGFTAGGAQMAAFDGNANGNITLTAKGTGGVFLAAAGSSSLVSLGWTGDPNTGFFKEAADRIAVAAGGNVMYFDTVGFQNRDGTAATPGYRFAGETSMGMYRVSSGVLGFATNGTQALTIDSSQNAVFAGQVVAGTNLVAGAGNVIAFSLRSRLSSASDGVLMIANAAQTDFSRLQFGGTSSSFPALKRSGTDLQVRLADDSAYTSITALHLNATGNAIGNGGLVTGAASGFVLDSSGDGIGRLVNNARTDFGRLQFGGTTSSFPALKRSSATLQARLADDSAFASFNAATFTASSNFISSATSPYFANDSAVAGTVSYGSTAANSPVAILVNNSTKGTFSSTGLAVTGDLSVTGALSKGSGSFKIDHPLPEMEKTHYLVHSFTESPRADLYYRGRAKLKAGGATVNLDQAAGMTEGTFAVLVRDVQVFIQNDTGWTPARGSVEGNVLTITAKDPVDESVSWLVIGERKDKHMMDTDWTDDDGRVVVEPLKAEAETKSAKRERLKKAEVGVP